MPFIDRGGVRLFWDEKGAGSPVLLIMGHRYSSRMWYPLRDDLAARYRVIWFDNRGTGQSDTSRGFAVGDMAEDALAVMDAAGVQRADVHGVSMGGVIAQELALRQPGRVRSLILGCTGVLSAEKPRMPAFMRVLYYVPPRLLGWLLNRGGGHGYGSVAPADKVAKDQAMLAADKCDNGGVAAQAAAIAGYVVSPDAIRGLTMPALVLHGDEDATVPYSYGVELSETLPNARLVTLAGCTHNYFVGRGPEASAATLAFLDEQDAAEAAA